MCQQKNRFFGVIKRQRIIDDHYIGNVDSNDEDISRAFNIDARHTFTKMSRKIKDISPSPSSFVFFGTNARIRPLQCPHFSTKFWEFNGGKE